MGGLSASSSDLMCSGLPTSPLERSGPILVTGASGYIGGRLVPELLARGYKVRAMVRAESAVEGEFWPDATVTVADAFYTKQLEAALEGVSTAYYLIHSLYLGPKEFASADITAAANFRDAAQRQGVKRIIYLGGLGDVTAGLSSHLRSRIEVAQELSRGQTPVTILRAAIIIGSGSASYEIILGLARRLRLMVMPHWGRNRCQPISIRDVIRYLVGVLETPATIGREFDIGGPDVLSYSDMLRELCAVLHKRSLILHWPFSGLPLYAYLVSLVTPVPHGIARCLLEGLKNEVICRGDTISQLIPFPTVPYREAIVRAMSREEQDAVYTRWSDAYPPAHELALRLSELDQAPEFSASYSVGSDRSSDQLFRSACRVGGQEGWFEGNWMWKLRGLIDRLLKGVGTTRGRKHYPHLRVNDVIDFWRVEAIEPAYRLLLRSEMKMPGKAWLEFQVVDVGKRRSLSVMAHYQANGIFGVLYWYFFLPFHRFIFKGLIEAIEKRG